MFDDAHSIIADDLAAVEHELQQQIELVCADQPRLAEIFAVWPGHRGKRLRPRLTLLSGYALQPALHDAPDDQQTRMSLRSLAAITELVHTTSLIHDDVLDQAITRRGHVSLNARFGDRVAVLAGDILYAQIFEMLQKHASKQIGLSLVQCVRGMCGAEITGMIYTTSEEYESIIKGKTAVLMQFCCTSGAETAYSSDSMNTSIAALGSFGLSFGMIYQLADDLRDGDVNQSVISTEWMKHRIAHYMDIAEVALLSIPDSPYREELAAMLTFAGHQP